MMTARKHGMVAVLGVLILFLALLAMVTFLPTMDADAAKKPTGCHGRRCTPTPTPTPTVTPTVTPSSTPTTSSTPTPTPTATSTPPGSTCTAANAYTDWAGNRYDWTDTSASVASTGGWGAGGLGAYYADAGMWNAEGYNVTQHTVICSESSWYVVNTSDNTTGDGAVKTYPNTHMDFIDWSQSSRPLTPMSNFTTFTSDFANTRPASTTGLNYDTAYDIWFNDVGNSNTDNEVMIWTDYVAQRPLGSKVTTVNLFGHQWDLWVWSPTGNGTADSTGAQYIALLPTDGQPVLSGQIDVMALYRTLNSITVPGGKLLPDNSKIGQVGYGVEFVSTGRQPVRWDFTNFNVRAS